LRYTLGVARATDKSLGGAVRTSALLVCTLFLVMIAEAVSPIDLRGFGVTPRTPWGLVGILFCPLLHANMQHLLANAVPLFVLLVLLFWDKRYFPLATLALIWLASGFGTWLIGRSGSVHIGASSIIYGLVSYLVTSGFLMRSWRAAVVALLVLFFYGGIIYGVLPQRGPISWEGHLSGVIAGIWAARRNHD